MEVGRCRSTDCTVTHDTAAKGLCKALFETDVKEERKNRRTETDRRGQKINYERASGDERKEARLGCWPEIIRREILSMVSP